VPCQAKLDASGWLNHEAGVANVDGFIGASQDCMGFECRVWKSMAEIARESRVCTSAIPGAIQKKDGG
jgi:hypothetical protein